MASNFLVTLEAAAERLLATAGADARAARPARPRHGRELGRATAPSALTGPIARGDEATVARQRAAVAERTPELLELFDALADATRDAASWRRMRTLRTVAELRAALRARAAARAARSASCRRWAPCTRATSA